MSAATPDHVLRAIANNARGIGPGPTVTRKQWQSYALDLNGWFTWGGQMIDMSVKSMGGGLYRIEGTHRYPAAPKSEAD